MSDEEKKQQAIDLLVSKRYPRVVAEAIVRISGPDKILAGELETVIADLEQREKAKTKPPENQTHHEDCGDVGETGEHGELGENAAGWKGSDAQTENQNPGG